MFTRVELDMPTAWTKASLAELLDVPEVPKKPAAKATFTTTTPVPGLKFDMDEVLRGLDEWQPPHIGLQTAAGVKKEKKAALESAQNQVNQQKKKDNPKSKDNGSVETKKANSGKVGTCRSGRSATAKACQTKEMTAKASFKRPAKVPTSKLPQCLRPEDFGVPKEAWPQSLQRGSKSYTVVLFHLKELKLKVEVNLKGKHYYIHKLFRDAAIPKKHWTWNVEGGPVEAWKKIVKLADENITCL
jgi:hypothetical protein